MTVRRHQWCGFPAISKIVRCTRGIRTIERWMRGIATNSQVNLRGIDRNGTHMCGLTFFNNGGKGYFDFIIVLIVAVFENHGARCQGTGSGLHAPVPRRSTIDEAVLLFFCVVGTWDCFGHGLVKESRSVFGQHSEQRHIGRR